MPNDFMTAVIAQINAEFLWLVLKLILAAVVVTIIKAYIEGLAALMLFRWDKNIAIGTPVEIGGRKGRIQEATWSVITVEFQEGFVRIPTKDWRSSKYFVLKQQPILRRRLADDNESPPPRKQ